MARIILLALEPEKEKRLAPMLFEKCYTIIKNGQKSGKSGGEIFVDLAKKHFPLSIIAAAMRCEKYKFYLFINKVVLLISKKPHTSDYQPESFVQVGVISLIIRDCNQSHADILRQQEISDAMSFAQEMINRNKTIENITWELYLNFSKKATAEVLKKINQQK